MSHKNKYNQTINSTRGLAVLLVLFFHLELTFFKGGFIGVDVFFVISGYLISKKIIPLIEESKFNFKEYILRRLKRILPSYLFVIIITSIIISLIFVDTHYNYSIKEILYSQFFFQNFYYWDQSGYFGIEKLYKPLLNTWSLAVEVQFYILFPILYFLLKKKIIFLIIISLFLSFFYADKNITYFILPTRFYEFGIGIIVYLIEYRNKFKKQYFSKSYFFFGILLIFFSILIMDENTQYPGVYALIPTLGTGFIIYYSLNKNANYLINSKLFIFFGNISYSLYLIHWPLIIFYKYVFVKINLSIFDQISLFFLSIYLSYLLTFYFERGFYIKNLKSIISFKKILILYCIFIFIIISFFLKQLLANKVVMNKNTYSENEILLDQLYIQIPKKKILIIGNSHGYDLYKSLINNDYFTSNYKFNYIEFSDHCFHSFLNEENFISQLEIFINNKYNASYKNCLKNILEFKNTKKYYDTIIISNRYRKSSIKFILPVIKKIKNNNNSIIILNNGPRFIDPKTFVKLNKNLSANELNQKFYFYQDRLVINLNDLLKNQLKFEDIKFFDKYSLFCNDIKKNCFVLNDKKEFIFNDKDHLSIVGYKFFGEILYKSKFYKLF